MDGSTALNNIQNYEKDIVIAANGFKLFIPQILDSTFTTIVVARLAVKVNGIIVKTNTFTHIGTGQTPVYLMIPIVTTQSCKIFFNWNGPSSSF